MFVNRKVLHLPDGRNLFVDSSRLICQEPSLLPSKLSSPDVLVEETYFPEVDERMDIFPFGC